MGLDQVLYLIDENKLQMFKNFFMTPQRYLIDIVCPRINYNYEDIDKNYVYIHDIDIKSFDVLFNVMTEEELEWFHKNCKNIYVINEESDPTEKWCDDNLEEINHWRTNNDIEDFLDQDK